MGVGRLLRLTVGWLRPYWRIELVVLATMLVSLAFTIILPLSFRFLIDRAILPGDRQMLAVIMAVLTGLFALNVVASLIKGYVTARLGANVMNDMRLALFTHLQRLSAGFYAQAKVGDVLSRLSTDLSPIQNVMTNVLPTAIQLGLSVAISGVLLFVLEWRLALLTLVAIPVLGISTRIFGPRAARASYKRQQGLADVATDVQENIGAQTVVRAFGLQDREIERFKARIEELGQTIVRMAFLSSLMTVMATLTGFLVQMLVVGVGAFVVLNGDLTLGSLIAFLGLLGNVLAPLLGATDLVRSVQYATGGMQRVEELLGEDVEVVDAPDARPLPGPTTEIRVDDLSFSYTGEQLNLNEVSLKVGMGDHVAFVGPSGCGKSTMLSLFMRFYDPTAGSITVDGHDLRNVSQASLRGHIDAVLQENIFFNISVRENIRLGRLDATDEEIETAAKAAEVHDDILGFPQGYDTVVGERGGRLSGGQRQRMAIARAVLRDPSVLLLDEATSALDPPTEAAVNATLERLSQGRTVLSVTHRLSSVVEADRIFVFDKGRLVDQGEHRELVDREGVYRDLWERQQGFIVGEGAQYVGVEATRLQAIPLFKDLDGVMLAAIANRFAVERFPEDEVVFQEGDFGDKLYIVMHGHVEVLTTGPTGEEVRLAALRDGDYFGEMALLEDVPRMAAVRTRAPTQLLSLEREQFLNLMNTIPDMRSQFERAVRLRQQENVAALKRSEASDG